ncbi:uncharacterized protein ACBR49_009746 [Aulostomus maculatus]
MILMGRSSCLPSQAIIQELFSVARDASIIPDISLDPVLTTFLSLDSSAALQHQYAFLQRSMSKEQQAAFNLGLARELGGNRVTHGGVGVVALALSILFDQIAHQARGTEGDLSPQRSHPKMIFGISSSSRIGLIAQNYLRLVPGIANDLATIAETTELYDYWLKLELLDHYERMTTKKRMSTVSMQQWLTGAAIHLHMRIHQVRLHSVPVGSVESLRLSYKSGLGRLVQGYTTYLRSAIQETGAPGPWKRGDERQVAPNASAGYNSNEESGMLGFLVIEPLRNVSHNVSHHPCESPAIQQALVSRIINAQDLERNRNFFLYPEKVFHSLLRQRDDFELKTNWTEVKSVPVHVQSQN